MPQEEFGAKIIITVVADTRLVKLKKWRLFGSLVSFELFPASDFDFRDTRSNSLIFKMYSYIAYAN